MRWLTCMVLTVVTGLANAVTMNIQGKIVNANQQPLSGAIAMLASSGQSTISGGDGAFALTNTNAISTEIGEVAINKGTIQIRGNTIYFLFPQSELPANVTVYNAAGKRIYMRTVARTEHSSMSLPSGLSQGLYFLTVKNRVRTYGFEIRKIGDNIRANGFLQRMSPTGLSVLKKPAVETAVNDTLIISYSTYASRRITIDNYVVDIGTVVLQRLMLDTAILSNADSLYAQGVLLFNRKAWDSASVCFGEYISRYPTGAAIEDARYYFGRSLYEIGDYRGARKELAAFLADYPATARKDWAEYYIGQTWYGENNYDSARVWFADVVSKYPDSLSADDALYFRGRCEFETKNYTAASTDFVSLITTYSLSSYLDGAMYYRGLCDYESAQYDTAVSVFQKFITDFPQSPFADNAEYYIGKCYYRKKSYAMAISQFSDFLTNNATSSYAPNAQLGIGDCWFEQGSFDTANYRAAIKEYMTCISNWPDAATTPSAYEGIGESYYLLGDITSARTWLERIETEYPQSVQVPASLYFLGRCDMNDSLYDDAIGKFDRVLVGYPASIKADNALHQKARCYYYKKEYTPALALFGEYRASYPLGAYCDNSYYYTVRIYIAQSNCTKAKSELALMETGYPASQYLASTHTLCTTNCP